MGDYLPVIDLGNGYTVIDISTSYHGGHSCALLENGTDFIGLKCWGSNSAGQLGLGDFENRGDEENEMGDELPFISVIFPASPGSTPTFEPTVEPTNPTFEPTEQQIIDHIIYPTIDPTTYPTSEPTTKCESSLNCTECIGLNTGSFPQCLWHFVDQYCYYYKELDSAEIIQNDNVFTDHSDCIPTTNPTLYPSNNPTAAPTKYPTAVPTIKPTKDPTIVPSASPTLEPTTKCDPNSDCTECLNMNVDGITWCLWQPAEQHCYFVAELDDDEEHGKSHVLSCGEDDSAISAQQSNSNINILLIIIGSSVSVVLCAIIILKIRRKFLNNNQKEDEIEMVEVNVRQKTIEVSESGSVSKEKEQIEGAMNDGNVTESEEERNPDTNTPKAAEIGDV